MRTYHLTDRDFQEFYAIILKIETENRLAHGHQHQTSPCKECDLMATYRYHLISWRNRAMEGDTDRHVEPLCDDVHETIKREITRLTKLLPKENPKS